MITASQDAHWFMQQIRAETEGGCSLQSTSHSGIIYIFETSSSSNAILESTSAIPLPFDSYWAPYYKWSFPSQQPVSGQLVKAPRNWSILSVLWLWFPRTPRFPASCTNFPVAAIAMPKASFPQTLRKGHCSCIHWAPSFGGRKPGPKAMPCAIAPGPPQWWQHCTLPW